MKVLLFSERQCHTNNSLFLQNLHLSATSSLHLDFENITCKHRNFKIFFAIAPILTSKFDADISDQISEID